MKNKPTTTETHQWDTKTISRSPLEEKLATEVIAIPSLSFTLKNAEQKIDKKEKEEKKKHIFDCLSIKLN